MHTLREQLIKAGLITEAAAVDKPKRERAESPTSLPDTAGSSGAIAGASKAGQRLNAREQLELDRRLRQIATQAQVPIEPGECAFHFVTRKGKVRRLELSAAQVKKLEQGMLAIVERPEPAQIEHSVVPAASAEEMLRLSPTSVRFYAREGAPIGCSDPGYASQDAP